MIKRTMLFALLVALVGIVQSCVSVKTNALFDVIEPNPNDTLFYVSNEIYHDYLTSEQWNTNNDKCVTVKAKPEAAYAGDLGMHIIWNRQGEGCPWLGLGFGWDNWTGKDLSSIKNEAALEFYVRMPEGERANLPWAIGLEDFNGATAYLGMTSNAIKAANISTEWTRIELPLSEFNWTEQDADASNIKQVIFQLEADGDIYMDEVRIVPYSGGYRKRATIPVIKETQFIVDGLQDDFIWQTAELAFASNKVHLAIIDSFLCVAMQVVDADPLQNVNTGDDTYNGDAFEIAFSTNPDAALQRSNYLSTDQHIGFALGEKVSVWNWRTHKALNTTQTSVRKTADGYVFEAKINLKELGENTLLTQQLYGLEMAVDHGNVKGRVTQERWNDAANDGFHENPSRWGEMFIVQTLEVGSR